MYRIHNGKARYTYGGDKIGLKIIDEKNLYHQCLLVGLGYKL